MNKSTLAVAVLVGAAGLLLMSRQARAAMEPTNGILGQQNGSLQAYRNFRTYDALFIAMGAQWGVDPLVLKAIALQESSLNPAAVNPSNPADPSYGLMQMSCMPDGVGGCLANEFALVGWPPARFSDLFDPTTNVGFGAQLLAQNLHRTGGDMAQAVAMYNSGSTYDPAYVALVGGFYAEMGGGTL